jgi:hypothetical protein
LGVWGVFGGTKTPKHQLKTELEILFDSIENYQKKKKSDRLQVNIAHTYVFPLCKNWVRRERVGGFFLMGWSLSVDVSVNWRGFAVG